MNNSFWNLLPSSFFATSLRSSPWWFYTYDTNLFLFQIQRFIWTDEEEETFARLVVSPVHRTLTFSTLHPEHQLHLMQENMKIESKLSEVLWKFPVSLNSRLKLPSEQTEQLQLLSSPKLNREQGAATLNFPGFSVNYVKFWPKSDKDELHSSPEKTANQKVNFALKFFMHSFPTEKLILLFNFLIEQTFWFTLWSPSFVS